MFLASGEDGLTDCLSDVFHFQTEWIKFMRRTRALSQRVDALDKQRGDALLEVHQRDAFPEFHAEAKISYEWIWHAEVV